jgi:hypothetical protein
LSYTQWKVLEQEDLYSISLGYSDALRPLQQAPFNVPAVADNSLHNSSSPYFDSSQNGYKKFHPYTADMLRRDYKKSVQSSYDNFNRISDKHFNSSFNLDSNSLWKEFKRVYFQEVLRFTMNKATFFTLIFSFMFLGCIFFLMGFLTATNIHNHKSHNSLALEAKQHLPSEQALLQGRPAKIANMGQQAMAIAPKAFQMQSGVRMASNARQPSTYVQKQIDSHQPNYR